MKIAREAFLRKLYSEAVVELLQHEFEIQKNSDRTFDFKIKNNFHIEYYAKMTWFFGMAKKEMPVSTISPQQIAEKMSRIKGFSVLRNTKNASDEEIVRRIAAAYAMWALGVTIKTPTYDFKKEVMGETGASAEFSWEDFFNSKEENRPLREVMVEEDIGPIIKSINYEVDF